MPETKQTPQSLESRLARLEAIVASLERDDLELEAALALFEEGIGHIRDVRQLLEQSELRIARLLDDGAGGAVVETIERDAR